MRLLYHITIVYGKLKDQAKRNVTNQKGDSGDGRKGIVCEEAAPFAQKYIFPAFGGQNYHFWALGCFFARYCPQIGGKEEPLPFIFLTFPYCLIPNCQS